MEVAKVFSFIPQPAAQADRRSADFFARRWTRVRESEWGQACRKNGIYQMSDDASGVSVVPPGLLLFEARRAEVARK